MLTVVALGGNALLRRNQDMDVETQLRNVERAAAAVAHIAQESEVVITHGNGPQVGLLAAQAQQAEAAPRLDVVGAESEGMIGYLLAQAVRNAMPQREVATVLTQTVVSDRDPAFETPTKFIGKPYDEAQARSLEQRHGWRFKRDDGRLRRVVASPEPLEILEQPAIAALVKAGTLVIAAGGGGVPVVRDAQGRYCGREAVVDKDKVSAVLADALGADRLLLLTDVDAVYLHWGTPQQRALRQSTPAELTQHRFARGSMAPKVAAACRFVSGPRVAAIGELDAAAAVWSGDAGTRIYAADPPSDT